MKRIFADVLRKDWYDIFLQLKELVGGRAYSQFIGDTEPLRSDLVIVDSFDDLIAHEELFGSFTIQNQPVLFVVLSDPLTGDEKAQKHIELGDNICVCCIDNVAEYIASRLTPNVVLRETLLAEKPALTTNWVMRYELFEEQLKFEPIFDD
jgi:hypothetical protein